MSPFLKQNGMDTLGQNDLVDSDVADDVYNDIIDQIALGKEALLMEGKHLTDNKSLEGNLQLQDDKVKTLLETLNRKTKHLEELNEVLKRKKMDVTQLQSQRSSYFDVVAEVFKDTKKFSSKAGHEITQTFASLGFDIGYDRIGDQAVVKIEKDGKWFKLGLNEHIQLSLVDMSPKHDRFDDLKILFDDTKDIIKLF